MNDKDLHRQKRQAQLAEWKADLAKLKARVSGASADAQLELNRHVEDFEQRMHAAGAKFSELADSSDEAWEKARKEVESTWAALKAGVNAAAAKLKE